MFFFFLNLPCHKKYILILCPNKFSGVSIGMTEKGKDGTLHVVCSLIPEIHFTVGPTRNAISAILNGGHRIIVQTFPAIPNKDVEGFSDHKLSCPSFLACSHLSPSTGVQSHYVTRQPKGRPKSPNMMLCPDLRGSSSAVADFRCCL